MIHLSKLFNYKMQIYKNKSINMDTKQKYSAFIQKCCEIDTNYYLNTWYKSKYNNSMGRCEGQFSSFQSRGLREAPYIKNENKNPSKTH